MILFVAWSAPSAIGLAGVGVGGQAGAEMTDFLIVLNSRSVSYPLRPLIAADSFRFPARVWICLPLQGCRE